ncbi:MAG: GNAT family N-acetyltransferase [Mogibacterium sp.]|nr:GNAT family N-acetyltransferase [Mogibacterium sp.]
MHIEIRPMLETDRAAVLAMMRDFYHSEAVLSDGSDEIFERDITACVSEDPMAEGWVFTRDGVVEGYAMITRGFSTEYGKPVIWLEDLFLREKLRGTGLSDRYFDFVKERYPDAIHRLDTEPENTHAIEAFKRNGFEAFPYFEMIRR